jgi:hypothetical protein
MTFSIVVSCGLYKYSASGSAPTPGKKISKSRAPKYHAILMGVTSEFRIKAQLMANIIYYTCTAFRSISTVMIGGPYPRLPSGAIESYSTSRF